LLGVPQQSWPTPQVEMGDHGSSWHSGPTHDPFWQELEQVTLPPHDPPLEAHVCWVVELRHWVELGAHTWHVPPLQTGVPPEHAVPLDHAPLTHVWGVLPLHWVWVGPHTPPHAPVDVTHDSATGHVLPLTQAPWIHVCGVELSAHCVCVGPHEPPHWPVAVRHVLFVAHVLPLTQTP
jgi:hypothetical protein